MNINLFFDIILILFAILVSNGILYSLTIYNLNKNLIKKNSSENISVITNSSEKDGLAITSIIASNPLNITSSESSASQTLSVTSSETNLSQDMLDNINGIDSEINLSQDILDNINGIDLEISEGTHTESSNLSSTDVDVEMLSSFVEGSDYFTSIDSETILDSQTYQQWREIASDFNYYPINSPPVLLQQTKFEELNILYSQDIINFGITQTELRLIIEHLPATSLFNPEINHFILTIMSYYHY